jgi:hypothetical protein
MSVIFDIAGDGLTDVQTILVVFDNRIMPLVLIGVTTKLVTAAVFQKLMLVRPFMVLQF